MWMKIALLCVLSASLYAQDFRADFAQDFEGAESNTWILEPTNQSAEQRRLGRYYTNEGYRAANFGAKKIARELFYKACGLGDNIGCLSLNMLNAPVQADSLVIKKQECALGIGEACFWLFQYYANDGALDVFKTDWYLDKACRAGVARACELKSARFTPFVANKYQLLENLCINNDAQSCYALGVGHIYGKIYGANLSRFYGDFDNLIVAKNPRYGVKLLNKACALGWKGACKEIIKLKSN